MRTSNELRLVLGSRAVLVALQLVSPALYLHFLSVKDYGIWLLLFAVPSLLTFLDLGFPHIGATYLAYAYSRKEVRRFQLLGSTLERTAGFSGILLMVGGLAAVLTSTNSTVRSAGPYIVAYFAVAPWFAVMAGVLRASDRISDVVVADMASQALAVVIPLVVLALHGGLINCAIAILGGRALMAIWYRVLLKNRTRGYYRFIRSDDFGILREIAKPCLSYAGSSIAQAAYQQGGLLLVAAAAGPVAVTIFATTRTLARFAPLLILSILELNRARIAHAAVRGRYRVLSRLNGRMFQSMFIAGVGWCLTIGIFGPWLYPLWTAHGFHVSHTMMALQAVAAACAGVNGAALLVVIGFNRHSRASVIQAVLAFIVMPLTYWATKMFGVGGAAGSAAVFEVSSLAVTLVVLSQIRFVGLEAFKQMWRLNPLWVVKLLVGSDGRKLRNWFSRGSEKIEGPLRTPSIRD